MNLYDQIAAKIIKEQELLMGPVAWSEASKVHGLHVDTKTGAVSTDTDVDGTLIINNLVSRYEGLFGRAGKEVCKEAVSALIAELKPTEVPSSLK